MTHYRHLSILIFLLFALSSCKSHKRAMPTTIQLPLSAVTVEDVPEILVFTGEIYGYRTINIDARVAGYLRGMMFREGAYVSKGELLYTLESSPYLQQTAQYEASLQSAQAALVQARKNYDRVAPLARINAASQSDLDTATDQLRRAEASEASARAALESSRINLSYTQIKSPVAGIIGQTQAYAGAYVGVGSSTVTLNTVSQIDSVKIGFYLPENTFIMLKERPQGLKIADIRLTLSNGDEYPYSGRFNFINRQVDTQSGSLRVETVFPNPDTLLRPGAYALVSIVVDTLRKVVVVPQSAVNQMQGRQFVYLRGHDGSVSQRSITTGATYKNLFLVHSGLSAGDTIITAGFHKLTPGVKVEPSSDKK